MQNGCCRREWSWMNGSKRWRPTAGKETDSREEKGKRWINSGGGGTVARRHIYFFCCNRNQWSQTTSKQCHGVWENSPSYMQSCLFLNIALTHHFASPFDPEWVLICNYSQHSVLNGWLSPLHPFISLYFRYVQLNWDHMTLFETHYSNLAVACTILPPQKSTDKMRLRLGAVKEKTLQTLK